MLIRLLTRLQELGNHAPALSQLSAVRKILVRPGKGFPLGLPAPQVPRCGPIRRCALSRGDPMFRLLCPIYAAAYLSGGWPARKCGPMCGGKPAAGPAWNPTPAPSLLKPAANAVPHRAPAIIWRAVQGRDQVITVDRHLSPGRSAPCGQPLPRLEPCHRRRQPAVAGRGWTRTKKKPLIDPYRNATPALMLITEGPTLPEHMMAAAESGTQADQGAMAARVACPAFIAAKLQALVSVNLMLAIPALHSCTAPGDDRAWPGRVWWSRPPPPRPVFPCKRARTL